MLDAWWDGFEGEAGAVERALLLPRPYFPHFATTSFVVERPDGELAALPVGFLSQTEPDTAYIHFAGVDPALHGQGVGQALYRAFFAPARAHDRRFVHCVTSRGNTAFRSFHTRLGFSSGDTLPEYDGPGLARVAFTTGVGADPSRRARRMRVPDTVLTLEHHPDGSAPDNDDRPALVRAPDGLTVARPAGSATPVAARRIAPYDASPDHGLDEPGLSATVLVPLARRGVPVFTVSTHHADLVLVLEQREEQTLTALRSAGFAVGPDPGPRPA